jgi:hypothetical protein
VSAAPPGKGSGWLPPSPSPEDLAHLEPWLPSGIEKLLDPATSKADPRWGELRYIVIDELHEQMAGLVLTFWPRVDERGRLCFGEEEDGRRLAVGADALLEVLRKRRIVPVAQEEEGLGEAMRQRELIVGDAFAAFVTRLPGDGGRGGGGGGGGGGPRDPPDWLEGSVLDITAEARDRVKAQASAAASGVIDEEYMMLIEDESDEDEPPRTPRGGSADPNTSGGGGESGSGETPEVLKPTVASSSRLAEDELEQALTEPAREQPVERHDEDEMTMGA